MLKWMLVLCCWPLWSLAGEEPEPLSEIVSQPVSAVVVAKAPAPVGHPVNLNAYVARYEVRYNGLKVGELKQQLSVKFGGQQSLQTAAKTTGVVALVKSDEVFESSLWREVAGELQPLSYIYRYTGRSEDIVDRLDFDWVSGKAKSLHDGQVTELAVKHGTYDRHMYQVVLRYALLSGEKQISYPVVDKGELQTYEFEVLAEERVETDKFGPLNCLKVKKGTTRIWVAREFDYLPIKIEKEEDGTTVGTYLIELTGG